MFSLTAGLEPTTYLLYRVFYTKQQIALPTELCEHYLILICILWGLNPRIFTIAGLKSAALDHSAKNALKC